MNFVYLIEVAFLLFTPNIINIIYRKILNTECFLKDVNNRLPIRLII